MKELLKNYIKSKIYKLFTPIIRNIIIEYHKSPKVTGKKGNLEIANNVVIRDNVEFECKQGVISVGEGSIILQDVKILSYGGVISIGNNVSINSLCILYGHGGLTIGDNVRIANSSIFIPSNHNFNDINVPIWKQGETSNGIVLEDDIWIGSNVKVLDNVRISKGIVVGAGSVVTKSLDKEYGIYVGVPAKFIKYRYE